MLLNGSLSRSTVSFLASATKREKLCAGNPEKSNRSTEVFAFLAPNLVQAAVDGCLPPVASASQICEMRRPNGLGNMRGARRLAKLIDLMPAIRRSITKLLKQTE
ncbi:MAG: hypothetical protein WA196_10650, partial [Pseudolabrys sp.]